MWVGQIAQGIPEKRGAERRRRDQRAGHERAARMTAEVRRAIMQQAAPAGHVGRKPEAKKAERAFHQDG